MALTALAIVIGVSFVSGTFILGDTITHTFTALFDEATKGTDVVVRGEGGFSNDSGEVQREGVPVALLDTLRRTDGVRVAEGSVAGYAEVLDKDNKSTRTPGGAPALGFNWTTNLNSLSIVDGKPPVSGDEMTIDRATAKKAGYHVGDRAKVLLKDAPREFTIVGITKFGEADNLGGATLATFEEKTALSILAKDPTKYSEISVAAKDGVSSGTLLERIAPVVPKGYEAVTGSQSADEQAKAIVDNPGFRFFRNAILVFGLVALFVAAFIIANTFQILVAQRSRELAMLRALGASRGQVMSMVVGEAVLVGVVSSVVGLVLGLGLAKGLLALLKAFGVDLPTVGLQFAPRTAVVSLLLGTVTTTLAAMLPGWKASRIAPVAAIREATATHAPLRRRVIFGAAVTALAVTVLLVGLLADVSSRGPVIGLGVLGTFLGVYLLSPAFSVPLAGSIAAPLPSIAGVAGKLARANSVRNPRRTAATASALMIGLALVGAIGTVVSSAKTSFGNIIDRSFKADYTLNTSDFMPFSSNLATQLSTVPGITAVSSLRWNNVRIDGSSTQISAIQPETYGDLYRVDMVKGALGDITGDGVLISDEKADAKGWHVGDNVRMQFSAAGFQDVPVRGIYAKDPLLGDYLISTTTYDKFFSVQLDNMVFVKGSGSPADTKAAVETVSQQYPVVDVRDQAAVKKQQQQQIDQLLGLISAMLGLSILIAGLGIANTLALSVYERTRELGLLRAVGMGRRQVRRMIRWEAVVLALFGAVLGGVVGLLFGVALQRAFVDFGIDTLTIPFALIISMVFVSWVLGVLAAMWPAFRASRLNILGAIAYE
jgi:putative ABC transport system permease protein